MQLLLQKRLAKKAKGLCVPKRMPTTERRRWQRIHLAIPVFVRGADEQGKQFLEFTTALNISAGGALLAIRRYLPRSSRVSLEIPSAPLPPLSVAPHFVKTIGARLVHITHSDECDLWGLKFTRPLTRSAKVPKNTPKIGSSTRPPRNLSDLKVSNTQRGL